MIRTTLGSVAFLRHGWLPTMTFFAWLCVSSVFLIMSRRDSATTPSSLLPPPNQATRITRKATTLGASPTIAESRATFLVKTMDRPKSCSRLLKSIWANWPNARVIVADDGEIPADLQAEFGASERLEVLRMPPDYGLSASRNALIEKARTDFVVLLDDDFEFDGERANVERLLRVLSSDESLAIVAGALHLPNKRRDGKPSPDYFYSGLIEIEGGTMFLREKDRGPVKGFEPNCSYVDIAINFFVARTEELRKVRWDPELKLAEHEDFFLRARDAGLRVAACRHVSILHHKEKGDKKYQGMRVRGRDLWKLALRKHGVRKLVLFNGYTVTVDSSDAPHA